MLEQGSVFWSVFIHLSHVQILLGFFRKKSEQVLILSHARETMRMESNSLLLFFRTRNGNTKNETYGVSFKLFSRSIKMKRLSSNLVLFTLVKVFEENI
jgi:hypothetical protein